MAQLPEFPSLHVSSAEANGNNTNSTQQIEKPGKVKGF